jgi:prepilin-type N-terminal cleavage/methylation domain-containing protein
MRISLAGKRNNLGATREAGLTLIEMIVVVALIAILVGISFPSMASGIETLRLNSASQSIVSFINGGLNRAERRQQVVEVTISKAESALSLRSAEPGFERRLQLPEGIRIESVLPEMPEEEADAPRSFLLYPGGSVPGFGLALVNRKGAERIVRVDPITGVPQVENLPKK